MSDVKERPTAHHSVQRHSPNILYHHYLIRKMVVFLSCKKGVTVTSWSLWESDWYKDSGLFVHTTVGE